MDASEKAINTYLTSSTISHITLRKGPKDTVQVGVHRTDPRSLPTYVTMYLTRAEAMLLAVQLIEYLDTEGAAR